jgi:hypothetical protein
MNIAWKPKLRKSTKAEYDNQTLKSNFSSEKTPKILGKNLHHKTFSQTKRRSKFLLVQEPLIKAPGRG